MTIPFLVMAISLVLWFIMAHWPKVNDPWLLRVCEIVFTVSALVVLLGMINKPAFL